MKKNISINSELLIMKLLSMGGADKNPFNLVINPPLLRINSQYPIGSYT